MEKLNWRESLVLNLLADGEAKRVSGSGAGPATLDLLVSRGYIVHVLDPKTRAEAYRITAQGLTALKGAKAQHLIESLLLNPEGRH